VHRDAARAGSHLEPHNSPDGACARRQRRSLCCGRESRSPSERPQREPQQRWSSPQPNPAGRVPAWVSASAAAFWQLLSVRRAPTASGAEAQSVRNCPLNRHLCVIFAAPSNPDSGSRIPALLPLFVATPRLIITCILAQEEAVSGRSPFVRALSHPRLRTPRDIRRRAASWARMRESRRTSAGDPGVQYC
jgi:hypothetical protein